MLSMSSDSPTIGQYLIFNLLDKVVPASLFMV